MLAVFLGLGPVPKKRRSGWGIPGGDNIPCSAFLAATMMQVPHHPTAAHACFEQRYCLPGIASPMLQTSDAEMHIISR